MLLAAVPARAADIAVLAWTQSTAQGIQTLRLPRTGSFTMDNVADGYLIVGVAITGDTHRITQVTWTGPGPTQAFHFESSKTSVTPDPCRTELWGLADPTAGPGFVTVTVQPLSGSPPAPSLAGAIISFSNVASTSTNGPCCANASNSDTGTSTISKTMFETSRGDVLVNSVCTQWTGAAPGTPGPDPARDPEMVPRTFQTIGAANLQHFTGTSPGADVERPATSYRHLRWLQSGSRTWAIAGLAMHATAAIAVPPADAAPRTPDAPAPAPDAAPSAPDAATPPPDAGTAPPDLDPADGQAAVPADGARPPPPIRDGEADPPAAPDAEASPVQRQVSFQVGCACQVGAPARGGGFAFAFLVLLLRPRRRRGRPV
jgi:hypothetical protein